MTHKNINAKKLNAKFFKAFTIVEMLLYMALLTIFIGVMVMIFVSIMKSQINTNLVTSYEYDARYIMQKMFYDFDKSTDFDATIASYTTDVNNNLLVGTDRLNGPDTTVENLSFTKIDNSVQVKFEMNGKAFQVTFNEK